MPIKSVYVKDEDAPLWEKAQRKHGRGLSALLTKLLRKYMEDNVPVAEQNSVELKSITLNTREELAAPLIKVVFTGRWLITPEHAIEPESDDPSVRYMAGLAYALAITKKGAVAIYEFDKTDPEGLAELSTYQDFEEIQEAELEGGNGRPKYPNNVLAAFAEVLNQDFVVELDI